jgi:phosphatidylglycerophosphate synthase
MGWANRITVFRLYLLYMMPFFYLERSWPWLFSLGVGALAALAGGLDQRMIASLRRVPLAGPWLPWRWLMGLAGFGIAWWLYAAIPTGWNYWVGFGLFVVMALSDILDGYLARRPRYDENGVKVGDMSTALGALLDPVADKALVVVSMAIVINFGVAFAWALLVVILREYLAVTLRYLNINAAHSPDYFLIESFDELIALPIWDEGDRLRLRKLERGLAAARFVGRTALKLVMFLYRATVFPWAIYTFFTRIVFRHSWEKRDEKAGMNEAKARFIGKVKAFVQMLLFGFLLFVLAMAEPSYPGEPLHPAIMGLAALFNAVVAGYTFYSGVVYVKLDKAYIFFEMYRRKALRVERGERTAPRRRPLAPAAIVPKVLRRKPPEGVRAKPTDWVAFFADYGDSYLFALLTLVLAQFDKLPVLFVAALVSVRFVSWGVEILALQEGLIEDLEHNKRPMFRALVLWVVATVVAASSGWSGWIAALSLVRPVLDTPWMRFIPPVSELLAALTAHWTAEGLATGLAMVLFSLGAVVKSAGFSARHPHYAAEAMSFLRQHA